jgi:hypothetical protein
VAYEDSTNFIFGVIAITPKKIDPVTGLIIEPLTGRPQLPEAHDELPADTSFKKPKEGVFQYM